MAHARMTQAEFDALRPSFGRIALDTIDIARLVLVDGLTQAEVAAGHNMTKPRASWRRVEIWLPPEMAERVE